jgi:hypothetical protein
VEGTQAEATTVAEQAAQVEATPVAEHAAQAKQAAQVEGTHHDELGSLRKPWPLTS